MSIPEKPSNQEILPQQYGYGEVKVNTHTFNDKPTAFVNEESKVGAFIADHTDKEHQKQYAKQIFGFLVRALCN